MTNNRSVKFADEVDSQLDTIVHIEARRGLHKRETQQLWYTRDELAEQQAADQELLKQARRDVMNMSATEEDQDLDIRGLEWQSPEADMERMTITLDVVRAVLEEQQRQLVQQSQPTQQKMEDNIQKIAEISSELSSASRKKARKIGKQDAACVPEAAEREAERKRLRAAAKKEKMAKLQEEVITKTIAESVVINSSPLQSPKKQAEQMRRTRGGLQQMLGHSQARRQ